MTKIALIGTGIMGEVMSYLGYDALTAMDLSSGMLEIAQGKGIYRELHRMVMGEHLEFNTDYAGKGTVVPDPPLVRVYATRDGWLVQWYAVPGANRYRVYRNDTGDGSSPDEVGYTDQLSILVPYESPFVYFAVLSVSGINESEVSGWVTDNTPPPIPTTFDPEDDILGHRLLISALDLSVQDPGFKCWEIEQADDDLGTNSVALGQFGLSDFPMLVTTFPEGVTKYYRIRALDWADNASDWTDWNSATSLLSLASRAARAWTPRARAARPVPR